MTASSRRRSERASSVGEEPSGLRVQVVMDAPEAWPLPPEEAGAEAERAARAVLEAERIATPERPVELTITLTDDETVRALNRQWRGKDAATNVLSFPAPAMPLPEGAPRPLGDVILSGPVVAREAREAGVSVREQLAWMVVHGTLHILGYDHLESEERARMESREGEIMMALGHADPRA